MQTYCIHIKGIVQGVGFRPYIYRLAQKYKLQGEVSNGTGGVHFYFNGDALLADKLVKEIVSEKPVNADISSIYFSEQPLRNYQGFEIAISHNEKEYTAVCPDFAMCSACQEETLSPLNKRYLYPFTTCTNCGPRFSIIHDLPYDRVNTTMHDFEMCDDCKREYNDVNDRRYYSQTNSCHTCGVKVLMEDNLGNVIPYNIETIVQALLDAKILAVKGIGGYLLICDASQAIAIKKLRERKQRKAKPFAVMFKNWNVIEQIVNCQECHYDALTSPIAPIVLCEIKDKTNPIVDYNTIAPNLDHLGVMLPNTGMLMLIAHAYPHPLVCTSANLSGSPIYYNDEDVKQDLAQVYDVLVSHNRQITIPQDDSVMKHSYFFRQTILLRRSRGMAPNFWYDDKSGIILNNVVAFGADLKNTFAMVKDENLYLSQYLGDQASYQSQQSFATAIAHYANLVDAKVLQKIIDGNPNYYVNAIANEKWQDAATHRLQHHKAHFYSVLFEHGLMDVPQAVLGVIWDGVGYGDDHQVWGGEIFEYYEMTMTRMAHFEYFAYLLGDAMSTQPRIAALSFLYNELDRHQSLSHKFTENEWQYYSKLMEHPAKVKTSSVGRIFDAVASLLNLADVNEYEGQAAILLEQLALKYYQVHGLNGIEMGYTIEITQDNVIVLDKLKNELLLDIIQDNDKSYIAAKFHNSLADCIGTLAKGYKHIAFSGGAFQNGLLVDLILHKYKDRYNLYFNKSVPANDENIALGQIAYSLTFKNQQQCA